MDLHFHEDLLIHFSARNSGNWKGSSLIWQDKDSIRLDPNHARFQRTDQWMPVYSWLETLDTDELIKSDDIIDWLAANPEVKEQLYSRHSRYHLMHYIKKCHIKILKRKEKKKVWPFCSVDLVKLLYSWSLRCGLHHGICAAFCALGSAFVIGDCSPLLFFQWKIALECCLLIGFILNK